LFVAVGGKPTPNPYICICKQVGQKNLLSKKPLYNQMSAPMKQAIFITTVFFASWTIHAQPLFEEQTGDLNPFSGISVGAYAVPAFVDINGNGLQDAFFGVESGNIVFYKNTGTTEQAVFELQAGDANPLHAVDAISYSSVAFADIDGDGDFDAFIGSVWAVIQYYENTGDATNPVFVRRTGDENPLDHYETGWEAKMDFIDIDGDGDLDVFIGDDYGVIRFYLNTGNATTPQFVEQTGSQNPLLDVYVGDFVTPTFADLDMDGDYDLLLGEDSGHLHYFENQGTVSEPLFVQLTGTENPLGDINLGTESKPCFTDIDNDGDADVFIGNEAGQVFYFKNLTNPTSLASHHQAGISIGPNPTNGHLWLQKHTSHPARVRLLDNTGKIVLQITCPADQKLCHMSLLPLAAGVYFLEVATDSGTYHEKVIRM
jgi:hypothetical protein